MERKTVLMNELKTILGTGGRYKIGEIIPLFSDIMMKYGYNEQQIKSFIYNARTRGEIELDEWGNFYLESSSNSKYDFSDFEIIDNSTRKTMQEVLSVMADGMISANPKLLKHFTDFKAEIRIKRDSSVIALLSSGDKKINLGKNGRIKNYALMEKIKKDKIKFPIYYVGEWDEIEGVWIGKISQFNPNKGKKHIEK